MTGEVRLFGPVFAFPERSHTTPHSFHLYGNYPNPFNPRTTIRYTIPIEGITYRTVIRIFDLLGQEVVTLVDRIHQSGSYSVEWDGRDSMGNEVSSGLYMYLLMADGQPIDTKCMIKME
jgi:flagellar hook assembly protein FlgD